MLQRSLAESREKAQALIMAGEVFIDGQKASKPGQLVAPESAIELTSKLRYVGRGGLKLEAALQHFAIPVTGLVCAGFRFLHRRLHRLPSPARRRTRPRH